MDGNSKKLKGAAFDYIGMNVAIYGKGDPDTPDVSPEQWEATKPQWLAGIDPYKRLTRWQKLLKFLRIKKYKDHHMGQITIIRTGEDINKTGYFKPAWTKSTNFKTNNE